MKIDIEYDGEWPNLCSGHLTVIVDGVRWEFPQCCLLSGGAVWFDDDGGEHVEQGEWFIRKWPEGFPENWKGSVESAVNASIEWGCCGGCV